MMQQSEREVVILKPTKVFLSFLASQLPEMELPSLELLQTDATAYTITRHDTEEATLDEIEKHFPTMFHHELSRWLGEDVQNEIEGSFLDFLCCFKFELHSQIVLMENRIAEGKQLLRLKPRSVLLKWMKLTAEELDEELASALKFSNLAQLSENATVVVKNFEELTDAKPFVRQYFKPIFQAEMLRMCEQNEHWPQISSYQDFSRYFAIELHSKLIHLH